MSFSDGVWMEVAMDSEESHSAVDRNKTLVRTFIETLLNKQNSGLIDDLLTADFVDHNAPPEQLPGPAGVKRVLERILSVLADLRVEMEDMIAEGDRVVVRYRAEARHVGNFMGFPASGKRLKWTTISIYRIENGRIAERWGLMDHADLLRQFRDLDMKRSV